MRLIAIACWVVAVLWALLIGFAFEDRHYTSDLTDIAAVILAVFIVSFPFAMLGKYLWSKSNGRKR